MSELADVPRTRVYDAVDELRDRGFVDGDGEHPPEPRDETAIWGAGSTNSLVVVLRALFTWQLDDNRDSPNEL